MPAARRLGPLLAGALLLGGCSLHDNATLRSDDGGLTLHVGTIDLALASGGALVTSNVLGFYLSDQPDTCLAVTQAPVSRATFLRLRVAPMADGTMTAAIVPPQIAPSAGQAMGDIRVQVGGNTITRYDASGGSITWAKSATGAWSVTQMDVQFDGVADRVTLDTLTFPTCP